AADLGAELKRYLNGEPIHSRPISRTARTWRWCRRRPVDAGLLALSTLLLLFLLIAGPIVYLRQAKLRSEAIRAKSDAKQGSAAQSAQDPDDADDTDLAWLSLVDEELTHWIPMQTSGRNDDVHQPAQGTADWIVRDGVIRCNTTQNTWLKSRAQHGDFVLELEFKLPPRTNSGVYVRCPGQGRLAHAGLEIQVIEEETWGTPLDPTRRTGAIHGLVGPKQNVLKPAGEWNVIRIRCHGNTVQVTLNGSMVVDVALQGSRVPKSGHVGLVNWHGEASGVEFRNIRIASPEQAKQFKLGIIGLDTSHVVTFAKILNDPNAASDVSRCRVVAAYPKGSPDIQASVTRVPEYTEKVKQLGVEIVDSIEALINRVDCVLLETNDGRPHLEQALSVIKAGKPLFIDKPVAGSLKDAVAIYAAAEKAGVPMFSSSSLRYGKASQAARNGSLGKIMHCETHSPASLEPTHPDLFWYGIHGCESLFTVMGTGCQSVTRTKVDGKIVVTGKWPDGRIGIFREGGGYGGHAKGDKGQGDVGANDGYRPLVVEFVKMFRTGNVPVNAAETLEIYAFMEAADESKRQGGGEVTLKSVLDAAGAR
ncbi:MAG: DUF1080 domain-containing protein, partial [Planctomycetota bacterium]|nr:DUF1080 domain-containing protein [Planctomycetota bacterium]